jgi:hypothetical protein
MGTTTAIVLILILAAAAAVAYVYLRKRRSEQLKSRFGPEYDRVLLETGNRGRAERELEKRAHRTEKYQIRHLSPEDRETLSRDWRRTQALFVDDPPVAIHEADRLICDAMRRIGYPVADFEGRTEDLSVDHPHVVRNYRAAHDIARGSEEGKATTEDLRRAMVYYRELFEELIEVQPAGRH